MINTSSLSERQPDRSRHREMLVHNLGIFELRALARELGVPSPTTKRRDDLIELILDQIYSTEPAMRTSKRGRPYKKLSNLDDIMTDMTGIAIPDALAVTQKPRKYEEIVCFAQEVPVFSHVDEEEGRFKGVLRNAPAVGYFIDYSLENGQVFVSKEIMEAFNLVAGDMLEVLAKRINSQNQYMVKEVLSINFVPLKDYKKTVAQGKPIISNEKLPYGGVELFCGRRNLVGYKNNLYEDERFMQFADYCHENGYTFITLGVNTSFEDQIMFSGIETMVDLTTVYGSAYDDGYNRIIDAIALTQRLLDSGKKCVLFVSDIVSIFDTLDMCFPKSVEKNGHKEEAIVIAQKLISLGKALSDGSSATLVMTYRLDDKDDNYLLNEAKKVSKVY